MKTFFRFTKKSKTPSSRPKFLDGIQVKHWKGHLVKLNSYWINQTVVLKVLRRFGCPLCRYESRLLSELKPEFDALGIRLVAVGFEECGLDDFLAGGYWDWDLLVDTDRSIHTALDLKKVPVAEGLADLMSNATRTAIAAAQKSGIVGDLKGDGFQLGGTFIIERGTSRILYEHRQLGAGSYSSVKEIYQTCGGDPDDVEEKAPVECIVYKSSANVLGRCFKAK